MSYHLSAGPYDRNTFNDTFDDVKGSLPMYSVHEALARDRMREAEQRSARPPHEKRDNERERQCRQCDQHGGRNERSKCNRPVQI